MMIMAAVYSLACVFICGLFIPSGTAVNTDSCDINKLEANSTIRNGVEGCGWTFLDNVDLGRTWQSWEDDRVPRSVSTGKPDIYDHGNWTVICSKWQEALLCVDGFINCGADVVNALFRIVQKEIMIEMDPTSASPLWSFGDRVCTTGQVKPAIQSLIDDTALDVNCLNQTQKDQVAKCSRMLSREYGAAAHSLNYSVPAIKSYWDRLAVDVLICVRQVLQLSSCNDVTKKLYLTKARISLPSMYNVASLQFQDLPKHNYTAVKRCTVGVYGDPHLRVCFDDRLQTCAAKGRQVYLRHSAFQIIGVNEDVTWQGQVSGKKPTNLRRVEIQFYSMDGITVLGSYTAENGQLPTKFDSGTDTLGTGTSAVVISGGYRITFLYGGIGMTLYIRQWNGNYFFTLRMAENSITQSSGLLASGCPNGEVIGRGRFVGVESNSRKKRAATPEVAIDACVNITAGSQMNEACRFDVVITGKPEYASMALDAEDDIAVVQTKDAELRKNAVPPPEDTTTGCQSVHYTQAVLISFITTVIFISM